MVWMILLGVANPFHHLHSLPKLHSTDGELSRQHPRKYHDGPVEYWMSERTIMMKRLGMTYCTNIIWPNDSLSPFPGLTQVPSGIPGDIVHMDLSHNSIRQLRARDFHEARSLRTLNLKDNDLDHMEKGTHLLFEISKANFITGECRDWLFTIHGRKRRPLGKRWRRIPLAGEYLERHFWWCRSMPNMKRKHKRNVGQVIVTCGFWENNTPKLV